jgi:hypothetical protein
MMLLQPEIDYRIGFTLSFKILDKAIFAVKKETVQVVKKAKTVAGLVNQSA